MNKLVIVILILITALLNCVPLAPLVIEPNEPPVAYLDVVPSISAITNSTLYFAGHGTDSDGSIIAYEWRSSIDGIISNTAKFSTSALSIGRHTIYFKVQDNKGYWSGEVYTYINIFAEFTHKPEIHKFVLNPGKVLSGKSTALTWDVANAVKVKISPEIGDVPTSGTRIIYPIADTVYVITAENSLGTVTKEAELSILNQPLINLELSSIASEDGSIRSDFTLDPDPVVGIKGSTLPHQAFFSFDISMIPDTAKISSVSLDLSNHVIMGLPFNFLGALGVFHHEYETLDSTDYYSSYSGGAIYTAYTRPYQPYISSIITETVQQRIYQGAPRFQIRLQFEKYYLRSDNEMYLDFDSAFVKLNITYEE